MQNLIIELTFAWRVARDNESGFWIGSCKPLELAAQGETWQELVATIGSITDDYFHDALMDGTLPELIERLGTNAKTYGASPSSSPERLRLDVSPGAIQRVGSPAELLEHVQGTPLYRAHGLDVWAPVRTGDEHCDHWTFALDALPMSGFYPDPNAPERATQRVPARLTLEGTVSLTFYDGASSFQGHRGECSVQIPYEALDELIAALQKAKSEIPGIVAGEYTEFDERNRRNDELNDRPRSGPNRHDRRREKK